MLELDQLIEFLDYFDGEFIEDFTSPNQQKVVKAVEESRDWKKEVFFNTKEVDLDRIEYLTKGLLRTTQHSDVAEAISSSKIELLDPIFFNSGRELSSWEVHLYNSPLVEVTPSTTNEFYVDRCPLNIYSFREIYSPFRFLPHFTFAATVMKKAGFSVPRQVELLAEIGEHTPGFIMRPSLDKFKFAVWDTPKRLVTGFRDLWDEDDYDEDEDGEEGDKMLVFHCKDGPAVELRNGLRFYFLDGVPVPPIAIEDPDSITVDDVTAVGRFNAEAARILRQNMGEEKYLKEQGFKVVDVDTKDVTKVDISDDRSVPRMLVRSNRDGARYLVGTDGSTGRVYYMPVPASIRTCSAAHKWLCGFDESRIISQS